MLIRRLWRQQPGDYFCVSTKSASKEWKDNFFKRTELNKLNAFLEENKDKDLYFCPHGFSRPARLKEAAVLPHLLWADLDEADPENMKPRPTIAIESSPGRYVGLWVTEQTVTEQLNRRLTYHIGADKGGWDLTQVLRIPGTTNYKYHATPKVRVLWQDGASYSLSEIQRHLPKEKEVKVDGDPQAIYKRYQSKMSAFLRRELMNGKPQEGKRSEVLWRIANELLEIGVSTDETFILIKNSPWNKFAGRHNEDKQLQRELEKIVNQHFSHRPKRQEDDVEITFLGRSMAEVEEENIEWLWYPYLARGEITILEGDPGLGKSYLAQMISIATVDGKQLPSEKPLDPFQGRVAYFDMENSAGSVTKKRLIANGCVNLSRFFQEEEFFTVDEVDVWSKVCEALERLKPTLIVFDTINTYIGKADTYKASEVQQALARFKEVARRFNAAVIVLRHLTKGTKEKALYRGQGSIGFTGFARVVMTVGIVPDDPDMRAVAVTKLNIAKKPKALTFSIDALPDRGNERDRSKFRWGEFVDLSADEILAAPPKEAGNEKEKAEAFLRMQLEEGPQEVAVLERKAEAQSITRTTLQRAAEALGVKKSVKGFGPAKTSRWELR